MGQYGALDQDNHQLLTTSVVGTTPDDRRISVEPKGTSKDKNNHVLLFYRSSHKILTFVLDI